MIGIYEGSHPEPMPIPPGVEVRRHRVGKFRAVSHVYHSDGATISFVRVRVRGGQWSWFVEFFYVTRSEREVKSVDEVLASISVDRTDSR